MATRNKEKTRIQHATRSCFHSLPFTVTLFAIATLCAQTATSATLIYSTYLGGSASEQVGGIEVDATGAVYLVGRTESYDFPTANAMDGTRNSTDAFVLKLDASGTNLIFSTFLGGTSSDSATALTIDDAGNLYVAGDTWSTNFPTESAYQSNLVDKSDAFLAKIAPSGTNLVYSTYLGGSKHENTHGVAIDSSHAPYLAGTTDSTNFPTTNAIQSTHGGGGEDAFIAKLSPDGAALVYSTFLGGDQPDNLRGIEVTSNGIAHVVGYTSSSNFPTYHGIQPAFAGGSSDGYLSKISATGSNMLYSTYLGGTQSDGLWDIALDDVGNAYVAGYSSSPDFPTENPFQSSLGGNGNADVTFSKITTDGSNIVFSSYLGGNSGEYAPRIEVTPDRTFHIAGHTWSTNFPSASPVQERHQGQLDAFVSTFAPDGTTLLFSSLLGGDSKEEHVHIAVDSAGIIYLAGETSSPDFPMLSPFQGTRSGSSDAFLSRIDTSELPGAKVRFESVSSFDHEAESNVTISVMLSEPSTNTITVQYSVIGGSAVGGGVDYTLDNGQLTFAPGQTTEVIQVVLVEDHVLEFRETIDMKLLSPTNAYLAAPSYHTFSIESAEVDPYEIDDDVSLSSPISVAVRQTHSLHTSNDVDWMHFYALTGLTYSIEASDVSPFLDVTLEIYETLPDGSLSLVAQHDDGGLGGWESTTMVFLVEGLYHVRVASTDPATWSAASYGIKIDIIPPPRVTSSNYRKTYTVIAFDETTRGPLPTGSYATLRGYGMFGPMTLTKYFDANTFVSFNPIGLGVYTVEVTCGSADYIPLEDPDLPNQVANMNNEFYANPRRVAVATNRPLGLAGLTTFSFVPVVTAEGIIRDQWTGERIPHAPIRFEATSGHIASNHVLDGHPYQSIYKSNWFTRIDGSFPTNVILPATNAHLALSIDGYEDVVLPNALLNIAAGDHIDLGTIFVTPTDDDHNGIADDWEDLYFGGITTQSAGGDSDFDGQSDVEEYLSGTNPTQQSDVLAAHTSAFTTNGLTLEWPVKFGKTYRVMYSDDLLHGAWQLGGGPWEASAGQTQMQWTDTGVGSAASRCYRVEVVLPTP